MENKNNIDPKEKELFEQLEVKYTRSKADVWSEMENIIGEGELPSEQKVIRMKWWKPAIAAAIIVLLSTGLFMRLYTVEVQLGAGEFSSHDLPDGSVVHLNAESSISYHPYWWSFDRSLEMEGEAFFEVEKGEIFSVESTLGTTQVLGTSFNIFSRDNDYQVYCKTGKVGVSGKSGGEVIITPGQFAYVDGANVNTEDRDENEVLSWHINKFIYNTTALNKVLTDFERHYKVKIESDPTQIDTLFYTGIFDRSVTVDEALAIISLSFNLDVEKMNDSSFKIK
jgi:transmembrane sensor